jgi:hypothetical protein
MKSMRLCISEAMNATLRPRRSTSQWHNFLRAPDGTITILEPPGAVSPGGKHILWSNPGGAFASFYYEANTVWRGYLRAADGSLTIYDAPGAGTGAFQGTVTCSVNAQGVITGAYLDARNVWHAYIRAADGSFTTYDAPGAGTGAYQGTYCGFALNPAGAAAACYFDTNRRGSKRPKVDRLRAFPAVCSKSQWQIKGFRSVVESENPPNDILFNKGSESQVDLIDDLGASPSRISLFHLDDSADQIRSRAFGTWFCSLLWRKQPILTLNQGGMKAQQRGCFERNRHFTG